MNRGKGLGEKIKVGGEGAVEFLEFLLDDLRDGRMLSHFVSCSWKGKKLYCMNFFLCNRSIKILRYFQKTRD